MKPSQFFPVATALVLLTTSVLQAQQSPADEVKAIKDRYKAEFDKIAAAEETAIAPLRDAYAKELGRSRDAAKTKGDLNAVLALEAAIKAVAAGQSPPPAQPPVPALETAANNFERAKANALRSHATRRQQLEGDYTRAVSALEQRFTRSAQLDAAKLARDAKSMTPDGSTEVIATMSGKTLNGDESVKSEASFQPPVEMEVTLNTTREVRFGYACDQLIFNWENVPSELRIDGGPAGGQHKKGAGALPTKRSVNVRLTVRRNQMTLAVDGRERARWNGDFSTVNQPISIRSMRGTVTQVEQVVVRKLR